MNVAPSAYRRVTQRRSRRELAVDAAPDAERVVVPQRRWQDGGGRVLPRDRAQEAADRRHADRRVRRAPTSPGTGRRGACRGSRRAATPRSAMRRLVEQPARTTLRRRVRASAVASCRSRPAARSAGRCAAREGRDANGPGERRGSREAGRRAVRRRATRRRMPRPSGPPMRAAVDVRRRLTPNARASARRRRGARSPSGFSSRSSGGSTAAGAFCHATGRRKRRIAVIPTDVCAGADVAGIRAAVVHAVGHGDAGREAVVDDAAGARGEQLGEQRRAARRRRRAARGSSR